MTMRAVVLDEPGPVANLRVVDRPIPEPEPGWVRIKVMAFGLNRSELHTRLGLAEGVTFPGQALLVRGGTSSVGLATAVLAKRQGLTVLATTRDASKAEVLRRAGVDHVLIDDGDVASQARALYPDGVDCALELVGTPTLPDTLAAVRVHGVVCFTGMLSNEWIVKDFYPIGYLPRGVRLAAYGGEADDLPAPVLQSFLDDVSAGRAVIPIDRVFVLDQIREAHALMESGDARGKLVVRPWPDETE